MLVGESGVAQVLRVFNAPVSRSLKVPGDKVDQPSLVNYLSKSYRSDLSLGHSDLGDLRLELPARAGRLQAPPLRRDHLRGSLAAVISDVVAIEIIKIIQTIKIIKIFDT